MAATPGGGRKSKILVDILLTCAAVSLALALPSSPPPLLASVSADKRPQQAAAYYLVRWLIAYRNPEREQQEAIKKKSNAVLKRLENSTGGADTASRAEKLTLNTYEQTILSEVVAPEDIHVTFEGGCSYSE